MRGKEGRGFVEPTTRERRRGHAREGQMEASFLLSLSLIIPYCQLRHLHPLEGTGPCPFTRKRAALRTWIFGRKALGLRSRIASTALCLVPSFSRLLKQLTQLHDSQYRPEAKHSQYSLRHLEFLQLHCFLPPPDRGGAVPAAGLCGVSTATRGRHC
jgi:hypothetical protein